MEWPGQFVDRREAGRLLSGALQHEDLDPPRTAVLALPRGGVPVGYEIATRLGASLSVFVVRKIGVPGHRELAMGAIASGGVRVLNDEVVEALHIGEEAIERVAKEEEAELRRREQLYGTTLPPLEGRTVVLVDDGLATGSTMRAAVQAIRRLAPGRIIVAVPVGAPETCAMLRDEADVVLCLRTPQPFQAVGLWYRHFEQTTDDEVRMLLQMAAEVGSSR